jgi:hypothetical protein
MVEKRRGTTIEKKGRQGAGVKRANLTGAGRLAVVNRTDRSRAPGNTSLGTGTGAVETSSRLRDCRKAAASACPQERAVREELATDSLIAQASSNGNAERAE